MAANNIYLQVDFNSQSAQQNVNALNQGIAQTGQVAEKSSTQATKSLVTVNQSVKQVTQSFGELTGVIAGLGIERIAANFIQVGSELGRAQTMMTAFTGSAEEAAKVFEQIRAIAAQSPFRFKDLEETARQLLGFGEAAKEVPGTIKVITDQVAAMGGSIEDVNSIVRIFGRVMDKDFVGAMDLIRNLPQEGIRVMDALRAAVGKAQGTGMATVQEVQAAMKAGVLDPIATWQTIQNAMAQQTAGAGAKVKDAAQAFKTLGDAVDDAKMELAAAFGPAIVALVHSFENMLAPLAGVIEEMKKLPDPMKKLVVEVAAGTAAVVAFAGAWKLFTTISGPAVTAITAIGGALKTSIIALLENPELLAALGVVAGAVGIWATASPESFKKAKDATLNFVSDVWKSVQDKIGALSKEGKSIMGAAAGGDVPSGVKDPGDIEQETKDNLEKVQKLVQGWAESAGRTMLGALGVPAEAVAAKYKALFENLNDQIKTLHISPEHAKQLRDQLTEAQSMETDAKVFEDRKKHIDELAKYNEERVKGSYEAQIAYIEAMDAQDLRGKVAAIDQITDLRVKSAQTVAEVEKAQLQDTFDAQKDYLTQHHQALEASGVDVKQAIADLQRQMTDKQRVIDQREADETQKYRLEGWKKANDAIIEDQKRIYESFKGVFDQIFDALTGKSQNIGKAMGEVFKKLALDQAKELFSSTMASTFTQAAGYGKPGSEITRGSGIFAQLFQHGMAPRPPEPPPESFNPERAPSTGINYDVDPKGTAQRFAVATDAYNDATIRFAMAVESFNTGATVSRFGGADRMMSGSVASAIQSASTATGVPPSLLRAVAQTESSFNAGAIGPPTRYGQAAGLMQLMPGTAADLGVTDLFNPQQNMMGGATYLAQMLQRYNGDIPKALAAYNWGPANVDSGRPWPAETRMYVNKITGLMRQYAAQGGGAAVSATGGADLTGGSYVTMPGGGTVSIAGAQPYAALVAGGMAAPPGFDLTSPAAGGPVQAPNIAAMYPDLFGGPTVAAPMDKKQVGALATLAALGAGVMGKGGAGGGSDMQKLMGLFKGGGGGIQELFGIGQTAAGGTTAGTVLGSPGVGAIAGMGGMMLISKGMQQRFAPATVAGGSLLGLSIGNQMGMGYGQGLLMGAGGGLFMSGLQRGGALGMGMDVAGGALAGAAIGSFIPGVGTAIGAAVGAGVGLIAGAVRMFVQTEQEKIRAQIKQVYGIDISNRQILSQIQQIVDQNYGGNVAVAIRSTEVQNMVRLYALSTGQAANLPRQMYNATIIESGGQLQLQKVYSGGVQVQNPYTGPTTYQYQTAVTQAQGAMPNPGSGLGVPGGNALINASFAMLSQQQMTAGQVVGVLQSNPSAVGMANATAARSGDSRLTTTAALTEPLTLLS